MRKLENKQILPEFGNVLKVQVEEVYHGILPEEDPKPEVVEETSPAEENK